MVDHEDSLKKACGSDKELYNSLNTLGLFLNPQDQKEIDTHLDKVKQLEKGGKPSEDARYAYRILIRLGLQLNQPEIVKKYAEKEAKFAKDKNYLGLFIKKPGDASSAAKKYYEKILAKTSQ